MSIVASGLHVLRSDWFSRKYTSDVVFRGEPEYDGAICQWSDGLPAFERISKAQTEWAFTSTSTALHFARSWPFGTSSPRVLVLQLNNTNDGGGAYVTPIGAPWQYEVTLPPAMSFQFLGCERKTWTDETGVAHNVTYAYGYDITTQPRKTLKEEAIVLKSLRKQVTDQENSCAPFLCQKSCATWYEDGKLPRQCSCSGVAPDADPNKIYLGSKCEEQPGPYRFQAQLVTWNYFCVQGGDSDSLLTLAQCGDKEEQQWTVDSNGHVMDSTTGKYWQLPADAQIGTRVLFQQPDDSAFFITPMQLFNGVNGFLASSSSRAKPFLISGSNATLIPGEIGSPLYAAKVPQKGEGILDPGVTWQFNNPHGFHVPMHP